MSDEKPLKQSLKTMLEAESLTGQQLRDQNNLQSNQASKTTWFSQRRRLLTGGSAAIAASVLFVTGRNLFYDDDAIQEGIVREVLTNHIHIRKLDIETSSINEVASYFDRLAFAPFLSSQINRGSFELLGGRYCTLQGELASQLYLRNTDSGELATYYLAQYDRQHFGDIPDVSSGDIPKVVYERGYQMTIWRESNVVNIFTEPGSV
ncbi:MAG: hypothetical protein RL120_12580 [Gammaproteobacteria bacterium]